MRHLVFAITALLVGLVLGLVDWLTTQLLEWLISLSPFKAMATWTLFGITLPALFGFLILALLLATIVAWLHALASGRHPPDVANETLREINKASDSMERFQQLRVSDDGQHAYLAVHLEDADWNANNPFYTPHAMSTTPGLAQTGRYYFLVAHQDHGHITPISAPRGYENMEVMVLMRTTGLDLVNNTFWRGLQGVLSETDLPIPFFKLVSTGICTLFISWSSSRLKEQFTRYAQEELFPYLAQQRAELPTPPRGLAFEAAKCSFTVPGKRLHFRQDLRKVKLEKVSELIQALENDFDPFPRQRKAQLLFPLDDSDDS